MPTKPPRPGSVRVYADRLRRGASLADLAAEPEADELACLCAATILAQEAPRLPPLRSSAAEHRRRECIAHWLSQGHSLEAVWRSVGMTQERVRLVLARVEALPQRQRQRAEVAPHLPRVTAWIDDASQPVETAIARIRAEFPGRLGDKILAQVRRRIAQRRNRELAAEPKATPGLGNRLRLAILCRGMSQSILAQRVGIGIGNLDAPLAGRCSAEKAGRIAKALDVPALWLLTGAGTPAEFAGDSIARVQARHRAIGARLRLLRQAIVGAHTDHGRASCAAFGIDIPVGMPPVSAWKRALLNPETIVERVAARWAVPLAWLCEGKGDAKVQRMIGGNATAAKAWRLQVGLPERKRRRR